MELLQIIASSVFLFSLFGLFLLLISFASYRIKKNSKLILQTVRRNPTAAAHTTFNRITSIENLKFGDRNPFFTNKFIVLNENPIVTNNERKENYMFDVTLNSVQSKEYERLRPAKFYSLDELK